MTRQGFLARVRMHVVYQCLCGVEYDCSEPFFWRGELESTGFYYWSDESEFCFMVSWNPGTVVAAASQKGYCPLKDVAIPQSNRLVIGPPVTHALWLEDGQWYEADESGGIRPLRKSLHKDEPFHPFFMDAHAAATAWGWFRDLPPALHEAAFKIATLPVGSEVDRASAAFFTGDSEKHRRAEQLLASLGLNIDLFP